MQNKADLWFKGLITRLLSILFCKLCVCARVFDIKKIKANTKQCLVTDLG